MRKTIFLALIILLMSCEPVKTGYNKVTITTTVDGVEVQKNTGNDFYTITSDGEGLLTLYTIKGEKTGDKFSLSYYEESEDIIDDIKKQNLRFLNVKLGDKKTEWRAKSGHNIYMIKKKDTLGFIFGDNAAKKNSVAGSIIFIK